MEMLASSSDLKASLFSRDKRAVFTFWVPSFDGGQRPHLQRINCWTRVRTSILYRLPKIGECALSRTDSGVVCGESKKGEKNEKRKKKEKNLSKRPDGTRRERI